MGALTVELPPMHPAQRMIARDPARFRVMACGRRFGKTRLGALLCLATALERRRAWWIAPSYKMAEVGWRLVRQLAVQVPGVEVRRADHMLTFPGGGTVQVRSADNPDALRGEGLDFVVLDECAFMQEVAWTEALRPALSDRLGRALFISTPKGRNWFWRAWVRGQEGGQEWRSWRFPTSDNPYIAASEIEAARVGLPERIFQQEYLAEFLEDSGFVFRRVMDAATALPQDSARPGHNYVLGVDLARRFDFTAIVVLDVSLSPPQVVYTDRFNQIDWQIQVDRIKAVAERFRADQLIVDQTGVGDPIVEQLQRELYS